MGSGLTHQRARITLASGKFRDRFKRRLSSARPLARRNHQMRQRGHVYRASKLLERILLHAETSGSRRGANEGDTGGGQRLLHHSRLISRAVKRRNEYGARPIVEHLCKKFAEWTEVHVGECGDTTCACVLMGRTCATQVPFWEQCSNAFTRDQKLINRETPLHKCGGNRTPRHHRDLRFCAQSAVDRHDVRKMCAAAHVGSSSMN